MAFLSDLRESKKISWRSQMCNACLTRKYFESRAHLFEVKERDGFADYYFGGDCYIILTSQAAKDVYVRASAKSRAV
jgi:hypothetical protein